MEDNDNSLKYVTERLLSIYGTYMLLKICIDSDDAELKQKYIDYINERTAKMMADIEHIDAGVDLFAPTEVMCSPTTVTKVDYQVICAATMVRPHHSHNTGFYMYPRSSISKTSLRLANNVGIIDAGYRGHLIGAFDAYVDVGLHLWVHKYDRHLQICAPGLVPIVVELVDSRDALGVETERGDGGFGSTGR